MIPTSFRRIYSPGLMAHAERAGREAELTFELWRGWAAEHAGRASTVRQEEAATESGHDLRFPASSYRARRRWAGRGGVLIVALLFWAVVVGVIRFIAQQA